MKIQARSHDGKTMYTFYCQACETIHRFDDSWQYDGNSDKPTVNPSVLVFRNRNKQTLCHLFIKNGMIQYCSDSPHKLAGQTVELLDIPEKWLRQH